MGCYDEFLSIIVSSERHLGLPGSFQEGRGHVQAGPTPGGQIDGCVIRGPIGPAETAAPPEVGERFASRCHMVTRGSGSPGSVFILWLCEIAGLFSPRSHPWAPFCPQGWWMPAPEAGGSSGRGGRCRGGGCLLRTVLHINLLEVRAIRLALEHFVPFLAGKHTLARSDNTSIVAQVNHQGGTRSARLLMAMQLPGDQNPVADFLSRHKPLPGEWQLHPEVVNQFWRRFGQAEVDLFASEESSHGGEGPAPSGRMPWLTMDRQCRCMPFLCCR